MYIFRLLILVTITTLSAVADVDNPLAPMKLDNPRDTMMSFMSAMNDYRLGVETGDKQLQARLHDATRCFDYEQETLVVRDDKLDLAAIFLKEIIDRVIVIDPDLIPDDSERLRWRLKGTEIAIIQVQDGDDRGRYLFSRTTAKQAATWFRKVEHLPYMPGSGMGAGYEENWSPASLPNWAQETYAFLPLWQWLSLFLAILAGLCIKTIISHILHLMQRLASKTATEWDYRITVALEQPVGLFCAAIFWLYSIHALRFQGMSLTILQNLVKVVFSVALIWTVYKLADVLVEYLKTLTSKSDTRLDDQLVPMIHKALRIFIVVLGLLVMFQNLGIQVMSVLAGLGLGGLAFALAAKDMCANLFGSVMILLDRPFRVGDWVIAGGLEGTVEEIGFRSTRIRTFYNSVIAVPNATLANAGIDNMGVREYRRIKAFFGLTYDTPPEKMEAFLEGIRNIIEAHPNTRKDYYHVVFSGYGSSSLDVMLYCFLKVPDWASELVERQNIYLDILHLAQKIGVDFAFPTQTLHIESAPGEESLRQPHEIDADALAATAAAFGPNGNQSKPNGWGLYRPPHTITRGNAESADSE